MLFILTRITQSFALYIKVIYNTNLNIYFIICYIKFSVLDPGYNNQICSFVSVPLNS